MNFLDQNNRKILKDHLSGLFFSLQSTFYKLLKNCVILSALCNFHFIYFIILKQKQMVCICIKYIYHFCKIFPTINIVFPAFKQYAHRQV